MKRLRLHISGMTCDRCTASLREAMLVHPQVGACTVSLEPPRAEIQLDDSMPIGDVIRRVAAAGFTVRGYTICGDDMDSAK